MSDEVLHDLVDCAISALDDLLPGGEYSAILILCDPDGKTEIGHRNLSSGDVAGLLRHALDGLGTAKRLPLTPRQ